MDSNESGLSHAQKKILKHQRNISNSVIAVDTNNITQILGKLQNMILEEMKLLQTLLGKSPNQECLKQHQQLNSLQFFSYINKGLYHNFNSVGSVQARYQQVTIILLNLQTSLIQNKEMSILYLENEVQLYEFLKTLAKLDDQSESQKQSIHLLKFLVTEIFLQLKFNQGLSGHHEQIIFKLLKLYIYGIRLPYAEAADHLIHKSVFETDLRALNRLCQSQEKKTLHDNVNQADLLGLTPLQFATRLNNRESAIICCENKADPNLRPVFNNLTPIEIAVNHNNTPLLRPFIKAQHELKKDKFLQKYLIMEEVLVGLPDFSCQIKWETNSSLINLPFLKKFGLGDTYNLKKLGKEIRIDMMGLIDQSKDLKKGEWSLLIKNKTVKLIDHGNMKMVDLMGELGTHTLENQIDQYLKREVNSQEYYLRNFEIQQCRNWRGEFSREEFSTGTGLKYTAKGNFVQEVPADDPLADVDFRQFQNYQQYFEFTKKLNKFNHIERVRYEKDPIPKIVQIQQELKFKPTKTQKQFQAEFWMVDNFFLKMHHVIPILEILALCFRHFEQLKDFFKGVAQVESNGFPTKLQIPLFMTLNTQIEFFNFDTENKISPQAFRIDEIINHQNNLLQQNLDRISGNPVRSNPIQNYQYPQLMESFREDEGSEIMAEASMQFKQMMNNQEDYVENLLDESLQSVRRTEAKQNGIEQKQGFHKKKQESVDMNYQDNLEVNEQLDGESQPQIKVFNTKENSSQSKQQIVFQQQHHQISKTQENVPEHEDEPHQKIQIQYNIYKQHKQKLRKQSNNVGSNYILDQYQIQHQQQNLNPTSHQISTNLKNGADLQDTFRPQQLNEHPKNSTTNSNINQTSKIERN